MRFTPESDGSRIPGSVSERSGGWRFLIQTPVGQVRRQGYLTRQAAEDAGKSFWLASRGGPVRTGRYERARLTMLIEDAADLVWPEPDDPAIWVYVCQTGSHIKVGVTKDLGQRIAEIRSLGDSGRLIVPPDVDIRETTLVLTRLGDRRAEAVLHRLLRNYQAEGEWFLRTSETLDVLGRIMVPTDLPPRRSTSSISGRRGYCLAPRCTTRVEGTPVCRSHAAAQS